MENKKEELIDLIEFFIFVWNKKILVFLILVFTTLIAIAFSLSRPNIYYSEALLVPSDEKNDSGIANLTGQFGGLAGLAGISLRGGVDSTALTLEVASSRDFSRKFITKYQIEAEIIAVRGWSKSNNKPIYDAEIYDADKEMWNTKSGNPPITEQKIVRAFMGMLKVNQDRKTGFVKIGFEHLSPILAAKWAALFVQELNSEIKDRDVREAKRSIEYLTRQLEKTSLSEMRSIFYQLIEEQTKVIMFAEVREHYALKVVDSAIIPEKKIKTKERPNCNSWVFTRGGGCVLLFAIGASKEKRFVVQ